MSIGTKYFSVSTNIFPEVRDAVPFDIYLKLGPNKFTKVFSKGIEIEQDRLTKYILKGSDQFYILKQDRRNFLNETQKVIGHLYKNNELHKDEAIYALTDLAAQTMDEIFSTHEFDYTAYTMSTTLVSGYLALTHQHPQLLPTLLKMAKTRKELYQHSIITSIFSCLLARQIEPGDRQFHLDAGLAGFLHDIGMCKLSLDVDEHGLHNSSEIVRQLHAHPILGANMLNSVRDVPDSVKRAVAEHHENMNGTGYPQRLPDTKISRLGRLLTLTEEFSALIGGSKENVPLTPTLAMHALRSTDRLDQNLVGALAELLKL